MTEVELRKSERRLWQREIVQRLEDFPRQYSALRNAMAAFGDNFDLREFKRAFNTTNDMDAYNRVQAVERALGRLQNFVAELSIAGMKLAQLPRAPMKSRGSEARQAFESMREAKLIDAEFCRLLTRAQNARSRIEHAYVAENAGNVHSAAKLVRDIAPEFLHVYSKWIKPYLEDTGVIE